MSSTKAKGTGVKRREKINLKDSGFHSRTYDSIYSDSDESDAEVPDRRKEDSDNDSSGADSSSNENSFSSSESDCMVPIKVVKRRKIKKEIEFPAPDPVSNDRDCDTESLHSRVTLPVSPTSSVATSTTRMSGNSSGNSKKGRSKSPDIPEDEWEVEEILDFVRDDYRELYYVKWKDWDSDFNTWEPISNLVNCQEELLRFREERKKQAKIALNQRRDIILPNGKRKRDGPPIPDVPPDPRPYEEKVESFFQRTGGLRSKTIWKIFYKWKAGKFPNKRRMNKSKLYQLLDLSCDDKLTMDEERELRDELVILEVEKKAKNLQIEIKSWEKNINKVTGGRPLITIENDVDLTGPPIEFEFVNDYVEGEGVSIPKDPPVGCGCSGSCYDSRTSCCASQFGYKYAYTRYGKIDLLRGSPIYECNSKCACGPKCPNRVVQDGKSDHKLSIFRTDDGRGWGVKTQKAIKKGSFVTLYVGEVIKSEEANRRGKIYDQTGFTYLFDLDFNDEEDYPYSVDASKYGNVAHFINHSCMPNLTVYAVWVDCLDPNLPKLALFATKDIARFEELTIDYNIQSTAESRRRQRGDDSGDDDRPAENRVKCLCGTLKCRGYIF